jgi:hypothetical protein
MYISERGKMTKEKKTLSPEHIEKLAAGRAAWKEKQMASRAVLKAELEKKRAAQDDGRVRTRLMPESSESSVKAESQPEEPVIPSVAEPEPEAVRLATPSNTVLDYINDAIWSLKQARDLSDSLSK